MTKSTRYLSSLLLAAMAACSLSDTAAASDTAGNAILSYNPIAFWELNETNTSPASGSAIAYDSVGGFDGTYGTNCYNGYSTWRIPGPQAPLFPGFASNNTAVQLRNGVASNFVWLPPLNVTTTNLTVLTWIYPTSNERANGIFSYRAVHAGGNPCLVFGYHDDASPTYMNYDWNSDTSSAWNWSTSGVKPPQNQWSLVALTICGTNAIIYSMNSVAWQAGTNTLAHISQTLNVRGAIGTDLWDTTARTFAGSIDDVAIYTNALSFAQISNIYFSAAGSQPHIVQQPVPIMVYSGATARFTVTAIDPAAVKLSYQWRKNGVPMTDGGNVTGSLTNVLSIANVSAASLADYSVVVSNINGVLTSSVASLTLVTPTDPLAIRALSLGALAFWELNETNDPALGSLVACDYVGSYNGTYQTNAQNGNAKYNIAGPRPPGFAGFTSTNTGLKTVYNATNSFVGVPGIDYVGNSATMVAWIYPSAFHAESGILFNTRDGSGSLTAGNGTNSCGLGFSGAIPYAPLMALWGNNGWNWSSGVYVPTNQWSMVAGVVTPTNITVYMVNASGLQSNTVNYTNPVCTWMLGGTNYIGMDPYDGPPGNFDGSIDDVAFFGYSLSAAQLLQFYQAGSSTNFIQIPGQPVSTTVGPQQTAQFTVTANSTAPLYYQWFAALPGCAYAPLTDGGKISGSSTATLTVSNASAGDCLNYYVQISNADGVVVNSSVVSLSLTSWEQPGQGGVVNAVATSPDGAWIASGSDDDTVKLWRASDGSLARTLAIGGLVRVTALAFSPDSGTLAAGYVDGSIRFWNPASGAQGRTINLVWKSSTLVNNLGKIASLSFSPDGQYLAAASGDLYTRIWKVSDCTMNQGWVKNAGPVGSVDWSPDGTKVVTGSEDKKVTVFSTNGWTTTSYTLGSNVTAVAFSPNSAVLAAGCLDGTVTFWQVSNMSQSNSFTGTGAGITALAFGTNSQALFSGDESGVITRWSTSSGWSSASQSSWSAHTNGVGGVRSLAVTADGSKLVSGGADYDICLWQASNGAALGSLSGHGGLISRASFSPDGSMVASASHDGSVRLWTAGSGAPLSALAAHTNQVGAMAFSPNSTLLVSGGGCLDNTLRIFSCSNLSLLRTIVATTNGVTALAVSPDSTQVASAGDRNEQVIRLWRVSDGGQVWQAAGHTNGTGPLAFSPNGQYLASGGLFNDGTVKLWNASNGSLVRTLLVPAITDQYPAYALSGYTPSTGPWSYVTNTVVHTCSIQALAFNPASTLLASAGERDGVVNVWQTGTGTLLVSLTNLPQGARSVAFSPDGTVLAAAGSDAIQMWRTADWQPIWTYTTETVGISSLGFSPNGTYLVFGRDDGTVGRIWNPLPNPVNLTLGIAPAGRLSITNPYSPFLSVWASSDPTHSSNWSLLTNVVASTNLVRITDPSLSLPPNRFYRVTTPP